MHKICYIYLCDNRGTFATVWYGVHKKTQKKVAIKVIDKKKLGDKVHMIQAEVDILKKIKHKNIVELEEVFDTQSHIYLVMELYVLYLLLNFYYTHSTLYINEYLVNISKIRYKNNEITN